MLSAVALTASTRFKGGAKKQALLVGVTLFVLTVLIGPFTGASFNPSRSLGPTVASMYFENQYVYWVGPISGSMISAVIFNVIGGRRRQPRQAPRSVLKYQLDIGVPHHPFPASDIP
jgi:glycerol uptake facilitator-like aquaporin